MRGWITRENEWEERERDGVGVEFEAEFAHFPPPPPFPPFPEYGSPMVFETFEGISTNVSPIILVFLHNNLSRRISRNFSFPRLMSLLKFFMSVCL